MIIILKYFNPNKKHIQKQHILDKQETHTKTNKVNNQKDQKFEHNDDYTNKKHKNKYKKCSIPIALTLMKTYPNFHKEKENRQNHTKLKIIQKPF